MKFLIAALVLCFALVGQIQGGSLRGYSLITPHKEYGVPVLGPGGTQYQEIQPIAIESTTSKPFVNDLPFISNPVNFGLHAEKPTSHIEPVTEKPELPLLQPGLPSLPAAPIVPLVNIEQPVQTHIELSGSYLPPTVISQSIQQPIKIVQELSTSNLPSKPELPHLEPGLPSLPAAPIVPLAIEEPIKVDQPAQVSNAYLPPKSELPILPIAPQVSGQINQGFSYINLPSAIGLAHVQPAASLIPLAIPQPIQISQQLSGAYLPPLPQLPLLQPGLPTLPEAPKVPLTIVAEQHNQAKQVEVSNTYLAPKVELPLLPSGLPSLPEAPKVPLTIAVEQPIQVAPVKVSNAYLPPKPELPLLQPGLPALPEAPKVPLTIAVEQPIQAATVDVSNTYLPPKPELPLLQPGLPSLPEAPKVPLTIAVEQPIHVAPVKVSNAYLPPKPELPHLQPGLPSLPEAPKVPLTLNIEQPIQVELSNNYLPPKPELPLLQPGLPALPEAPKVPLTIATEQPIQSVYIPPVPVTQVVSSGYLLPKPELPLLQPGLPALPEAPVIPASPQIIEESKIGYNYEKPATSLIENAQLSVEEIKKDPVPQAPIFINKPFSQNHIVLPSSESIEIPKLPEIPASPQTVEESKIGYNYEKPATSFIEDAQLSVEEIKKDAVPQAPIFINKPFSQNHIAPVSSESIEIPTLPEFPAPVIPASAQIVEEPKIGYTYNKPASAFIEAPRLALASREPIFINRPVSLSSSIQPVQQIAVQSSIPAQQVLVQPAQQILVQPAQQVLVQHSLPSQELLFQPSFAGAQKVQVQPTVQIVSQTNKAPGVPSLGYIYNRNNNAEILLPVHKLK